MAMVPARYANGATFYPTYKEWKSSLDRFLLFLLTPFYPTYKEWKSMILAVSSIFASQLFILPIRNGNQVL